MSRLATSFVLGYHGCDLSIRDRAVKGKTDILKSDKKYDWLGPGAYFWEADPVRALEWATAKASAGFYKKPAVLGAVIDLGNCLDLVSRENILVVKAAYDAFIEHQKKSGLKVPENKSLPHQTDSDRTLRFLDRAVINFLHGRLDAQPEGPGRIAPYDTVRGVFTEGDAVYEGCGFRERTHTQIAVRNSACIIGVFLPRAEALAGAD